MSDYLQVDVEHRLGDLSLSVSCALSAPWTVLFGPSGAGKTSLSACDWRVNPTEPWPGHFARTNAGGNGKQSMGAPRPARHWNRQPAANTFSPHECNGQCFLWSFRSGWALTQQARGADARPLSSRPTCQANARRSFWWREAEGGVSSCASSRAASFAARRAFYGHGCGSQSFHP